MYYNKSYINQNDGLVVYISDYITEMAEVINNNNRKIINSIIAIENNREILLSTLCRLHDITKTEFLLNLKKLIEHNSKFKNNLIMGDFNFDISNQDILTRRGSEDRITDLAEILTKAIVSAFNASAPLRLIVLSSRRKRWVSPDMHHSCAPAITPTQLLAPQAQQRICRAFELLDPLFFSLPFFLPIFSFSPFLFLSCPLYLKLPSCLFSIASKFLFVNVREIRPLHSIRVEKSPHSPTSENENLATSIGTRPPALLSEGSKVLERLVHDRLFGYLEIHNLFHPRPADFRRGYSTQTAFLGVLEDVRQAIDDRMLTFSILFDFSKAFDSIPHARLLTKLRALKSDHALRSFFSYLADRLQAVIDKGGCISDWHRASSRIP